MEDITINNIRCLKTKTESIINNAITDFINETNIKVDDLIFQVDILSVNLDRTFIRCKIECKI